MATPDSREDARASIERMLEVTRALEGRRYTNGQEWARLVAELVRNRDRLVRSLRPADRGPEHSILPVSRGVAIQSLPAPPQARTARSAADDAALPTPPRPRTSPLR